MIITDKELVYLKELFPDIDVKYFESISSSFSCLENLINYLILENVNNDRKESISMHSCNKKELELINKKNSNNINFERTSNDVESKKNICPRLSKNSLDILANKYSIKLHSFGENHKKGENSSSLSFKELLYNTNNLKTKKLSSLIYIEKVPYIYNYPELFNNVYFEKNKDPQSLRKLANEAYEMYLKYKKIEEDGIEKAYRGSKVTMGRKISVFKNPAKNINQDISEIYILQKKKESQCTNLINNKNLTIDNSSFRYKESTNFIELNSLKYYEKFESYNYYASLLILYKALMNRKIFNKTHLLDFHNLYVKECTLFLEDYVQKYKNEIIDSLKIEIITGKSEKIKPGIKEFAEAHNLFYTDNGTSVTLYKNNNK